MKRLRKNDDGDNKKSVACKRKLISRERLHQQRTTEKKAQERQQYAAIEAARIERLSHEQRVVTNKHHADLEAAHIEWLSLEDRATRCSQNLAQHSQRRAQQKPQERDVINQIRTLQYNGPAPPTDEGLTSLQHQIKHSIF